MRRSPISCGGAGCRSPRRCASPRKSRARSRRPTSEASRTAISSRPTSRSPTEGVVKVLDFGLAKARRDRRRRGRRIHARHIRRSRDRHRAVHEPRAGSRCARRSPHRHLGIRLRGVRNADRTPRLRRRHPLRHRRRHPREGAGLGRRFLPTRPLPVRRLLRRCLEKDHRRRIRDIGDVKLELEDIASAETPGDPGRSHGLCPGAASQPRVAGLGGVGRRGCRWLAWSRAFPGSATVHPRARTR